ncbi:MAG: hypothetical protein K2X57_22955 [Xanthobacteraceae bacterium]|nr:hypothetical protein [Xanthobacteraceae bacterium]
MWDELRALPLFETLSNDAGLQLAGASDQVSVMASDPLFPDRQITDAFWVLLTGRWRVLRRIVGNDVLMFEAERPGTWTGGIPVIDTIAPPSAEVLMTSRFARVPIAAMHVALASSPAASRRLLEAVEWGAKTIGGLIEERSRLKGD